MIYMCTNLFSNFQLRRLIPWQQKEEVKRNMIEASPIPKTKKRKKSALKVDWVTVPSETQMQRYLGLSLRWPRGRIRQQNYGCTTGGRWHTWWQAWGCSSLPLGALRYLRDSPSIASDTTMLPTCWCMVSMSKRLGHSSITTALDLYAHWVPEMDSSAANTIGTKFII